MVKHTRRYKRNTKRNTKRKYNSKRRLYKKSRSKLKRYKKNTTKRKIYKKYKKVRSKRNLQRMQTAGLGTYNCGVCYHSWDLGRGEKTCSKCSVKICKGCTYTINKQYVCMECFFIRKQSQIYYNDTDNWEVLLQAFRNTYKETFITNLTPDKNSAAENRREIKKYLVDEINELLSLAGDMVVSWDGKGFVCDGVTILGKWKSHCKTSENNQEWEPIHEHLMMKSGMNEIQPSSIKKYAYLDLLLSDPDEKEEYLANKGIKVDRLKAGINLLTKSKLPEEAQGYHCEVIYEPGQYYNALMKTEFEITGEVLIASVVKDNVMQGLLLMNKDDFITLADNVHKRPPAFGHLINSQRIEGSYVFELDGIVVVSKIPGDVFKDIRKLMTQGDGTKRTSRIQLVKNYTAMVGYYTMRNDTWFSTEMAPKSTEMATTPTYPSDKITDMFGLTEHDIYPKLQFFEGTRTSNNNNTIHSIYAKGYHIPMISTSEIVGDWNIVPLPAEQLAIINLAKALLRLNIIIIYNNDGHHALCFMKLDNDVLKHVEWPELKGVLSGESIQTEINALNNCMVNSYGQALKSLQAWSDAMDVKWDKLTKSEDDSTLEVRPIPAQKNTIKDMIPPNMLTYVKTFKTFKEIFKIFTETLLPYMIGQCMKTLPKENWDNKYTLLNNKITVESLDLTRQECVAILCNGLFFEDEVLGTPKNEGVCWDFLYKDMPDKPLYYTKTAFLLNYVNERMEQAKLGNDIEKRLYQSHKDGVVIMTPYTNKQYEEKLKTSILNTPWENAELYKGTNVMLDIGPVTFYKKSVNQGITVTELLHDQQESPLTLSTDNLKFAETGIDMRDLGNMGDEDSDHNPYTSVNFANIKVGSGALSYGCVQEELLLMDFPEMLAIRQYAGKLNWSESWTTCNAIRYNKYEGYGFTVRFNKDHITDLRKCSSRFVAIASDSFAKQPNERLSNDQIKEKLNSQYTTESINKELTKAIGGFIGETEGRVGVMVGAASELEDRLCTGAWGGGVFLSSIYLKFIIQFIAYELVSPNKLFKYCPWDNYASGLYNTDAEKESVNNLIKKTIEAFYESHITVNDIYEALLSHKNDTTHMPGIHRDTYLFNQIHAAITVRRNRDELSRRP